MTPTSSEWPNVRVVGAIEQQPAVRYSGMRDVHAWLSRRPAPEWQVLFTEALRTDPADRDASGIRTGGVPMIWAAVTSERAETINDAILEAVEVANLRYQAQWLPTLPDAEVAQIVLDAVTAEGRTTPPE